MSKIAKTLTDGQRTYEAKRAAKAGLSLEKWLALKERQSAETAKADAKARKTEAKPAKPPGFLSRWIEKAHKPL